MEYPNNLTQEERNLSYVMAWLAQQNQAEEEQQQEAENQIPPQQTLAPEPCFAGPTGHTPTPQQRYPPPTSILRSNVPGPTGHTPAPQQRYPPPLAILRSNGPQPTGFTPILQQRCPFSLPIPAWTSQPLPTYSRTPLPTLPAGPDDTPANLEEAAWKRNPGSFCFWRDEDGAVCGYEEYKYSSRFKKHFFDKHLATTGPNSGDGRFACKWPGFPEAVSRYGTVYPAEPPCGLVYYEEGGAKFCAVLHQRNLWIRMAHL
ncbi:hypothetical protein F4808DRAFT_462742 [Astrocystis sublimbata]|nr:hypothetical protein F4808DRAFT_462742 [Astrocystis sublimbata]